MRIADWFREWLKKFPKEPAERMALALAAVDAFETSERKSGLTSADLATLVQAASSPHKLVSETGCHLLVELAKSNLQAQQCILGMARDKDATARFHAVAYLHPEFPELLLLEIVQLALHDRSAKVKTKGIEGAERFKFTRFLPELTEMQRTDTNQGVQRSLALHIPLLRDGFLLEPSADGAGYWLTVRGPQSLGGPFIPKERYSEEFVRQEVARLQR